MQIETTRFGAIEIDPARVMDFPVGIPGFESRHRYVLLPHSRDGGSPFEWLQSVDDGALAFLAMRPHQVFPTYHPRIPLNELQAIGIDKGDPPPHIYTILTVPKGNPKGITANLLAPVVINGERNIGRQVIANNEDYGLRHRLIPD